MKNEELKKLKQTHQFEFRFEDSFQLWDFIKEFENHFESELAFHGRVLYFRTEDEMNVVKILK